MKLRIANILGLLGLVLVFGSTCVMASNGRLDVVNVMALMIGVGLCAYDINERDNTR